MPKVDQVKRFYYHVTVKKMGDNVTLEPRKFGGNRSWEEGTLARTCVGPDVAHCLSAIPIMKKKYYVYRTKVHVQACYTRNVEDSRNTKERWLIRPIKFKLVNTIPLYVIKTLLDLTGGSPFYDYEKQKQYIELFDMMFDINGKLVISCRR